MLTIVVHPVLLPARMTVKKGLLPGVCDSIGDDGGERSFVRISAPGGEQEMSIISAGQIGPFKAFTSPAGRGPTDR